MEFVDKDTIVIDDIFPLYFVKNHIRKNYANLAKTYEIGEKTVTMNLGGWGNGYVALPSWHPYHGMHYDKIPIEVHGGLTYSRLDNTTGFWVIGFDTNHGGDNLSNRSFEWVKEETYELLENCLKPKMVQRYLKLNRIKKPLT